MAATHGGRGAGAIAGRAGVTRRVAAGIAAARRPAVGFGAVFQNRERRLPQRPRGYYREYTVPTPGARDRGGRRIVGGGGMPGNGPPVEYYYSDDHYRSFRRFLPAGGTP